MWCWLHNVADILLLESSSAVAKVLLAFEAITKHVTPQEKNAVSSENQIYLHQDMVSCETSCTAIPQGVDCHGQVSLTVGHVVDAARVYATVNGDVIQDCQAMQQAPADMQHQ